MRLVTKLKLNSTVLPGWNGIYALSRQLRFAELFGLRIQRSAGSKLSDDAQSRHRWIGWWRGPYWFLALFTGAKSFADNPLLGSVRLNRLGLHVCRVRAAHWMASKRRRRLAHLIPDDLRDQFDRDGFIVVRNVFPEGEFRLLQRTILQSEFDCREQVQGDTVTRRVPFSPKLADRLPQIAALLASDRWSGLLAYAASTRNRPLYYVQTISAGRGPGGPDPQLELHSDTFHPSIKAWLFLTDVEKDGRPLAYVAGSHRATEKRLQWELQKSIEVMQVGDRLSQRGSLRIGHGELEGLGLPQPTEFSVPANTLVIADTCGFHARCSSDRPTVRVELWAYSRRSPFLPWTGGGLSSWVPFADRRAVWLHAAVDWLDSRGLQKQHWVRAGKRRPIDA